MESFLLFLFGLLSLCMAVVVLGSIIRGQEGLTKNRRELVYYLVDLLEKEFQEDALDGVWIPETILRSFFYAKARERLERGQALQPKAYVWIDLRIMVEALEIVYGRFTSTIVDDPPPIHHGRRH